MWIWQNTTVLGGKKGVAFTSSRKAANIFRIISATGPPTIFCGQDLLSLKFTWRWKIPWICQGQGQSWASMMKLWEMDAFQTGKLDNRYHDSGLFLIIWHCFGGWSKATSTKQFFYISLPILLKISQEFLKSETYETQLIPGVPSLSSVGCQVTRFDLRHLRRIGSSKCRHPLLDCEFHSFLFETRVINVDFNSKKKQKNNPSFAKKSSTGVHMEKTIQLGHPAEPGHTIIRVVGQATVHLIYTTSQTWSGRSWHPVGQWEDGNDGNVNVYVCIRVCIYIYIQYY